MSLQDDADRLMWAWTRLLVRLGVGRLRRAFHRFLDGPHLRDRWRTTRDDQRRAFDDLRAFDEEVCASMEYEDCCDMHAPHPSQATNHTNRSE